eukprot:TRINITY_DN6167_c0_g1_i3.p1 TRINITY_DN6167_c0_g1~~TRINITY_DN6167_c0_g1_i3.p1  ORF type:complete len:142 (+),score=31.32 TRINITY_DN6167_c0_g1_i3:59-427(+)
MCIRDSITGIPVSTVTLLFLARLVNSRFSNSTALIGFISYTVSWNISSFFPRKSLLSTPNAKGTSSGSSDFCISEPSRLSNGFPKSTVGNMSRLPVPVSSVCSTSDDDPPSEIDTTHAALIT